MISEIDCEFPREAMAVALARLVGLLSSRTTLPVLSCVRLSANADCTALSLEATDLDHHAQVEVALSVACEPFAPLCVPLDDLLSTAKAHNGLVASLRAKGDAVTFSCGRGKNTLPAVPGKEFPALRFLQDEFVARASLSALALREAFAAVRHAVWTADSTKPACMGVHLEATDGYLLAVAVNGPQLAKEPVCAFPAGFEAATIPTHAVGAFVKFFPNGDDVTVSRAGERVRFKSDSGTLTVSTLDSPFPNYRQVIPRDNRITVRMGKSDLLGAIARLALVHREARAGGPAAFTFDETGITVHTQSIAGGAAEDFIPAEVQGGTVRIGFNLSLLAETLKSLSGDKVMATLKAPEFTTTWQNEDGAGLRLLSPLRLNF